MMYSRTQCHILSPSSLLIIAVNVKDKHFAKRAPKIFHIFQSSVTMHNFRIAY